MTTPQIGAADVQINATVEVPVSGDLIVRDDTQRARYFEADKVTINYRQAFTDAGTADETSTPWEITAVVSGALLSGGAAGKRRASRTFRDDLDADEPSFPDWLQTIVDKFHPGKATGA